MCKLHTHVTQSAETDHANLLALADAPVAHGRVCCDSGAKQRSGSGEVQVRGDAQDEPLVDDNALGVATVGDASQMLIGEIVCQSEIRQNCSRPAWHSGQVRSESTMQPTAARSPRLNLETAEPTLWTRPTISWPGTQG